MPELLAYPLNDAAKAIGVKRTRIYQLIAEGKLDARKLGGRTVIPAESLRALIANLPRAEFHTAPSRPEIPAQQAA